MVKGQTLKKIVSVETIRENTVSTPGDTLPTQPTLTENVQTNSNALFVINEGCWRRF